MDDKQTQQQKPKSSVVVRVLAFEQNNDTAVRDRVIDLRERKNRNWLQDFIMWGANNHMTVEITNIKDEKE